MGGAGQPFSRVGPGGSTKAITAQIVAICGVTSAGARP